MTFRHDVGLTPEAWPLSFQQEEMLARMRAFPDSAKRYDQALLLDLRGEDVNAVALKAAFDGAIGDHDILRTSVWDDASKARQAVHHDGFTPVDIVDGDCEDGGRETSRLVAERVANERLGLEEVLEGRPLLRAQIMPITSRRMLLVLAIHHLAYDGHSLAHLFEEVSRRYATWAQCEQGTTDSYGGRQYGEFAQEQRLRWADVGPAAVRHYERCFAGLAEGEWWPAERDVAATALPTFEVCAATGDATMSTARRAASRIKASPFVVLLALAAIAAARVRGGADLVVGTDFAARRRKDRLVMGHMVNTRFTRVSPVPRDKVESELRRVRDQWLDAEMHADAYSGEIMRQLGRPATVAVGVENVTVRELFALPGVTVERVPVPEWPIYWRPLRLTWLVSGEDVRLELCGRPDLFTIDTAREVAVEVRALLAGL